LWRLPLTGHCLGEPVGEWTAVDDLAGAEAVLLFEGGVDRSLVAEPVREVESAAFDLRAGGECPDDLPTLLHR
jgi:hypothetical protein